MNNQSQRFQPRTRDYGARPQGRMQPQGRMKEQHGEDYAGDESQVTLEQHAGTVARGIIKHAGLEDTTETWKALKRAYLTGYDEATR